MPTLRRTGLYVRYMADCRRWANWAARRSLPATASSRSRPFPDRRSCVASVRGATAVISKFLFVNCFGPDAVACECWKKSPGLKYSWPKSLSACASGGFAAVVWNAQQTCVPGSNAARRVTEFDQLPSVLTERWRKDSDVRVSGGSRAFKKTSEPIDWATWKKYRYQIA
jgi:hypothetical protein